MEYPEELINTCWFEFKGDENKYPLMHKQTLTCFCCLGELPLPEFYFHEIRATELFFQACYCQSCYQHFLSFNGMFFDHTDGKAHLCKNCFSKFFLIIGSETIDSDTKIICVKRIPPSTKTKSPYKI